MYKENENDLESNKIIKLINNLLKEDDILHETDEKLTVLDLNDKTSYLGSVRVYDETKLPKFEKELKKRLNIYRNKSIRSQNVVSCCQVPHTSISFKIDILK